MQNSIALNLQFSSGIILFTFALLQLIYRNRSFLNYNLSGLYFCLSYIIFNTWIFGSGSARHFPMLITVDTAAVFAIGPFSYFYIRTVTGGDLPGKKAYALNFLLPVVALFSILFLNATEPSIASYYKSHSPLLPYTEIHPFTYGADILSNVSVFIYGLLSIANIAPALKNRKHRSIRELRFIIAYMAAIGALILIVIISLVFIAYTVTLFSIYVLSSLATAYFFFCFRYPEFSQKAVREGKILRADASPVNPEDTSAVIARIDSLMKDQSIFTDENLSLKTLSETINLPQYVISRAINDSLGMNFRSYLNRYRINEAKQLLSGNHGMSVLEIAFKTGFNSKSSFNQVFKNIEGKSPREYRAKPLPTD